MIAPVPPPVSLPLRIAYHDGEIWRRTNDNGWVTISCAPADLLKLYRKDAITDDWFRPIAAQLVTELEAAMREAGLIEAERNAA